MNTPKRSNPTLVPPVNHVALPASDVLVGDIEQFLMTMIGELEPAAGQGQRRGRPRVVPALCLWAGLLVCVVRGFTKQLALWRLLTVEGLWSYPRFDVGDEAIYKRLRKGGSQVLEALFAQVSQLLRARLAPYLSQESQALAPFAQEVMALDEATLDPMARLLPALREVKAGAAALLPGKLAGLFDVRRQQWFHVQHIPNPQQNEKVAARELVLRLPVGSLILADLGYFGFAWFDDLTQAGYHWISRLRAKTSYKVQHVFYESHSFFDGLVWLGAYRADQAACAVRLVRFTLGKVTYSYITNVLDPTVLPLADIARLYARRWDFELAIKLVKRFLKLHLLWASQVTVVVQQVWAVLIIAQILQAFRLEIAYRAGVEPFDVSMALLVEYAPRLAAAGQNPLAVFVERGRAAGFIRPSTRIRIQAPVIPPELINPLPPDLVLERTPRYAQRRCRHPDDSI